MTGACKVCDHAAVQVINKRLAADDPLVSLLRDFPSISKNTLARHRDLHLRAGNVATTGLMKDIEEGIAVAKQALQAGFEAAPRCQPDTLYRAMPGFLAQLARYHEMRAMATGELKAVETGPSVLIQIAMPRSEPVGAPAIDVTEITKQIR